MADELDDLRAHTKRLTVEKQSLEERVKKATEYLELIKTDRTKTEAELTIIEVTLDNLREEIA